MRASRHFHLKCCDPIRIMLCGLCHVLNARCHRRYSAEYADELAQKRAETEREQRMEDAKRMEAKQSAAAERIEAMKRQTEARIQHERRATIAAENEAKMQVHAPAHQLISRP